MQGTLCLRFCPHVLPAMLGVLLLLCSCGGGGEGPDTPQPTGMVRIENGTITFGGQANTHGIVGYTYILVGSGQQVSSGPVQIPPGASVILVLASGTYSFGVTYDDGRGERLQAPPDQVNVYASETTRVLFVY